MATITKQQLLDCMVPKEIAGHQPGMLDVVIGERMMTDPFELTNALAFQLYERFGALPQTWAKLKALPGFPNIFP